MAVGSVFTLIWRWQEQDGTHEFRVLRLPTQTSFLWIQYCIYCRYKFVWVCVLTVVQYTMYYFMNHVHLHCYSILKCIVCNVPLQCALVQCTLHCVYCTVFNTYCIPCIQCTCTVQSIRYVSVKWRALFLIQLSSTVHFTLACVQYCTYLMIYYVKCTVRLTLLYLPNRSMHISLDSKRQFPPQKIDYGTEQLARGPLN